MSGRVTDKQHRVAFPTIRMKVTNINLYVNGHLAGETHEKGKLCESQGHFVRVGSPVMSQPNSGPAFHAMSFTVVPVGSCLLLSLY